MRKMKRSGIRREFIITKMMLLMALALPATSLVTQVAQGTQEADERLKWSADFRLRAESDTNRQGNKPDRFRERLRLRTGAQYLINNYFSISSRLSTGDPDDPNSPHQTLGTVFNKAAYTIDSAFVQFKQRDLWLKGGKFSHPFQSPAVYSELVWDADIPAEGVAAGYTINATNFRVLLTAVEYILLEQADKDDATLTAGQASAAFLNKPFAITAAGGLYKYFRLNAVDLGADGMAKIFADNVSNAAINNAFNSDFTILDLFVNATYQLEISGKTRPITINLQYFKNFDAKTDQDKGYAVGIRIGDAQRKGDLKLYYQYQLVQQDAAFSPLVQDDFLNATNFQGHLFGVAYRAFEKTDLNLWGLRSKRHQPEVEGFQTRLRVDLNLSF